MQQMAYMGYQAPQQTIVMPRFFANSVLPMVPGSQYNHWHVIREDFQRITEDRADADFLRDLENQTNFLINKLRGDGLVPEGYLPDPGDLWIHSTPGKAEERTLHAWGHTKYWEAIPRLINKGFIKRRFAAPLLSSVVEDGPVTTVFLGLSDHQSYIVVDDADGNYQGADGETHNAVEEGHTQAWMIRREYLLCIEKIQAAQYTLAFFDPPEPAKRWPPVTRRRDTQKKAPASTDCTPNDAGDISNNQLSLQASAQGGTLKSEECQTSGHSHHIVDTKAVSTIRQEFLTNIPINSAISQEAEFSKAPWSPETLIELARVRHRPGLFEVRDDDEDYEVAEKLIERTEALRLLPRYAWRVIDQHICAMMDGEIWWATQRKGPDLRFTLKQVEKQWSRVEQGLKEKPYMPPDHLEYIGPPVEDEGRPRDHSWIFGTTSIPDDDVVPVEASSDVVEGSLEEPEEPIEEIQYVQEVDVSPGETEEYEEVQQIWQPHLRGMTGEQYDELFDLIQRDYPMIVMGEPRELSDGSWALPIKVKENQWYPVRNHQDWFRNSQVERAIADAVQYGEGLRQ